MNDVHHHHCRMSQHDVCYLNGNLGKGDLVGCDISLNLIHNGQQGASGTGGQDCILKSSSDVKVGHNRQ